MYRTCVFKELRLCHTGVPQHEDIDVASHAMYCVAATVLGTTTEERQRQSSFGLKVRV
jgi:hypothetical protein